MSIKQEYLYRWTLRLLLAGLVMTSLFFGLARILLPGIKDYRADMEKMVSEVLHVPVSIGYIETSWHRFEPVLSLKEVDIHGLTTGADAIRLDSLDVSLSLFSSLLAWDIRPSQVVLKMHELQVTRLLDGSFNYNLADKARAETNFLDKKAISWIFEQPDLHIVINQLDFRDRQEKLPNLKMNQLGLVFKNMSSGLVVRADASATGLVRKMKAVMHLQEIESADDLPKAKLYMQLDNTNLAGLSNFFGGYTGLPDSGIFNTEIWAEIDEGELQKVEGRLSSSDLSFHKRKSEPSAYLLDSLQTNFIWQTKDTGWALNFSGLQLNRAGKIWPETTWSVDYRPDNGSREYLINASYLRLGDVLPIVARQPVVPATLSESLSAMSPDGQLSELAMQLVFKAGEMSRYGVQSNFDDLSLTAYGDIPGLTAVDGYLAATDQAGLVNIKTRQGLIDFPELFRKPLALQQLTGKLNWSRLSDGWLIESTDLLASNSHIKTQSRLSIHLPGKGSPFVDLQTDFLEGDGTHASNYFPAHILSKETVEWLDKGIVSGQVEYGTLVLHGNLDDFPYDNKQGTFEIRFKVREGIIDYYEDWPIIDEIEAEVVFSGRGMRIKATAGKIFESSILNAVVEIPDLDSDNPVLGIRGNMLPNSRDLMRYLQVTKLGGDYQAALSQLDLSGKHKLGLSLTIPLVSGENKFSGYLDFVDNQLDIPAWKISLLNIAGRLNFDEHKFEAKDIVSSFSGQQTYTNIETVGTKLGRETHVQVDSHADLAKLISKGNKALSGQLKGISPVEVRIEIPDYSGADSRLSVSSPLTGTAIALPQPLGKTAGIVLPLKIKTGLSGDSSRKIDLRIGDQLRLFFFLGEAENKLDGMAVIFGSSSVDKLDEKSRGKFFIGGKIESLLLDDWLDWYNGLSTSGEKLELPPIETELQIDRLAYSRWYMNDINIQALRSPDDWIINLSGAAANGQISVPAIPDQARSVNVKLGQLSVSRQVSSSSEQQESAQTLNFKPGDIPSMHVEVGELKYQSRDLGSLKAHIKTQGDVFRLDQAALKNDETETILSAEWTYDSAAKQHKTLLNLDLNSKDFGNFLGRHGYDDTVKNGRAHIRADVQAPVALPNFSMEKVSGQADISIRRGRIVEIDPGSAGRIFGLLSFQALPRRLSLDFTDLFSKGMSFDEIDGHFTISNGQAYTNNLMMDAPAGRIDVSGRVGLSEEDYDELVKVTPSVSSSLPVAGAIAGGPGLAIVMYLTHKLLGDPINKITELEYKVTGPWDNPVVTRLGTSKIKVVNQNAVKVPETDTVPPDS